MEKMYLSQEEYDAVVDEYRSRSGYDEMTDEEKAAFDEKLDRAVGVKDQSPDDETDDVEADDNRSDSDKMRDQAKKEYGYDKMSDEEKASFDEKLDQVYGPEGGEDGDEDPAEKVLAKRR